MCFVKHKSDKCCRLLAVTCPRAIFSLDCCESAAGSKEFPALNQGAPNMRARFWNASRVGRLEMFRFMSLLDPI